MQKISRKEFLQLLGLSSGVIVIAACGGKGGGGGPANSLAKFTAVTQGSVADNMTAIGMNYHEEPSSRGLKVDRVTLGNDSLAEQKDKFGDVTAGLRFRINGQLPLGDTTNIHSQTNDSGQPMVQVGDQLGWELSSK